MQRPRQARQCLRQHLVEALRCSVLSDRAPALATGSVSPLEIGIPARCKSV